VVFANVGISAGPGFLNVERKRDPQRAVENIAEDLWDRVIDTISHRCFTPSKPSFRI
jgi:hypothetical protein